VVPGANSEFFDAERRLRKIVISSPETGSESERCPDHADGAESDALDICSCVSGESTPAEMPESLIKSGVSGLESDSSEIGEVSCGLPGLNSGGRIVVSFPS
jgi:hypothetical protein